MDAVSEPINPGGTAAFGAVVLQSGERLWECSRTFKPQPGREHETSNNVAEYSGLIAVLEWLREKELHRQPIIVRGDSKMVVEQMNGHWRIRKGFYVSLALRARRIAEEFPNLTFKWIPREQNGLADELSKRELINAGVEFRLQPMEIR